VTLEAVTVELPTVFRVMVNDFVPDASAAFAGSVAAESLEVIFTVSFVLIKFQFASTEFTVTLNDVPAVWPSGVPVLPLLLPGEALSPGTSNCNFEKDPTFTVT